MLILSAQIVIIYYNMINNIIHISDIHIRTGDSNKSRYNEYISTFDNLYISLKQQPSIINKTAVIVVTGDIFHDKNKIGPSGIKIATYLLQKLSSLATVYIIRGNHDYRQDTPNEPDMISALMSCNIPNIVYLDKSGLYIYQNIVFGLVAIQNTLLYGSTSGISAELPSFPNPQSNDAYKDMYKIALFHGTINGSTMQNGIKTTRGGYPIDWFQGYDAILLGDIHLQQINRVKLSDNKECDIPYTTLCNSYSYSDEVPWGYPGSLIQQDFGEQIKGHGYIIWDLQNKTIDLYHVKNNYGMIKLIYNKDIDKIELSYRHLFKGVYKNTILLNKIITHKWFPDNLNVRVYGDNLTYDNLRIITEYLQSFGKNILSITKKTYNIHKSEPSINSSNNNDIINIHSSDNLLNYVNNYLLTDNNKHLHSDTWKSWLLHPERILISNNNMPEKIKDIVYKKSENIKKLINEYNIEFDKIKSQSIISGYIKLHKLEWNWILNYKDNNVFDFDKNTKNISIINAKNGNGKSNFLEIICISLFGKGFPSRENKKYSANIICDKKPNGIMASSSITFTLNKQTYNIKRIIRNNSDKKKIDCEDITLTKLTNDTNEILHQKTAVNEWVKLNIGTHESYLLSAMLSQNADNDFFSLENSTQIQMLDKILLITHIDALKKLLKKSVDYYKDICELISTYYDGVSYNIVDEKYIQELENAQNKLNTIITQKNDLYKKWNMVSEKSLNDITNIQDIYDKIVYIQNNLKLLPIDNKQSVKSLIIDTDKQINYIKDELNRFYNFSDLDSNYSDDIPDSIDNLKLYISDLELELKTHPYYKNKHYSIYENIHTILNMIDDNYDNDLSNHDLYYNINEFETWNKIQNQKFSKDIIYFKDNSEFESLQFKINSLINIIQQYPNKILDVSKNIDKIRRKINKLNKEKEHIYDKRPNKPSKTKEWLYRVKQQIDEYGELEYHIENKKRITTSIKNIPLLCNKINNIILKINEYNEYITECSQIPFNPDCEACKKQPWKTKYDYIKIQLIQLENDKQMLLDNLNTFKYNSIEYNINIDNYNQYIISLEECLEYTQKLIDNITIYNLEKESWEKWENWEREYKLVKSKYDTLESELYNLESNKNKLEKEEQDYRIEKQNIQNIFENIQNKKQDYDNYIKELHNKNKEYELYKLYLSYNWYSTLYSYRYNINTYCIYMNNKLTILENTKKTLELSINTIKQREKYQEELDNLTKIYDIYPYWIKWKDLNLLEIQISLHIKELQTIINGKYITSNNEQFIYLSELIKKLQLDIQDISYISDTFDGYRDWIYQQHIGPLIQNNVNKVLEMICDDRPLYLECEWLKEKNNSSISWFIRDGNSRPVIQKASGFQRFIVGIAMRVAINQIGLSKMHYSELFIDEGFTACDSDNLEKVPDFLRGLLTYYDNIYLATHLEDLKGCTNNHIFIKRDDNGLSQIQYGDSAVISEIVESNKNKKRGRPPKNTVIVNKV